MSWLEKNGTLIQIVGGVIATLITLTAYALTTFQTKEEHKDSVGGIEKKLDKIEAKIDDINNYLRNNN